MRATAPHTHSTSVLPKRVTGGAPGAQWLRAGALAVQELEPGSLADPCGWLPQRPGSPAAGSLTDYTRGELVKEKIRKVIIIRADPNPDDPIIWGKAVLFDDGTRIVVYTKVPPLPKDERIRKIGETIFTRCGHTKEEYELADKSAARRVYARIEAMLNEIPQETA